MDLPVVATPSLTSRFVRGVAAAQNHWLVKLAAVLGILLITGVLVWQGITAGGNPDPTAVGINRGAVVMDTGILVFREGLEAILVLAALTASLVRTEENYLKPIAWGAGTSFLATIATWFIVVAIISSINAPALDIQAATGLLAIAVLLVVMNWFFHKVYWTGWITHHNRKKRALVDNPNQSQRLVFQGLFWIGFTCVYREGFEVVLFLQNLRLQAGTLVVLEGALIGLGLVLVVAFLTFKLHYKLPYKRMLVLTGVMLGIVLVVMIGENVQEMQQAGWIGSTSAGFSLPDWMLTWFAVFPTVQSLGAQALAVILVVGSYFVARGACRRQPKATAEQDVRCIVPDCDQCEMRHPETTSVNVSARQIHQ